MWSTQLGHVNSLQLLLALSRTLGRNLCGTGRGLGGRGNWDTLGSRWWQVSGGHWFRRLYSGFALFRRRRGSAGWFSFGQSDDQNRRTEMQKEEIRRIECPRIAQWEKDERRGEVRTGETRASPCDGVVQKRHLRGRLEERTDVTTHFTSGHRQKSHREKCHVVTRVETVPERIIESVSMKKLAW